MTQTPEFLPKWVEKIREEMHDQDKRIVKLETTNKVLYAVIGVFLVLAGMVITVALSDKKEPVDYEYVKPREAEEEK